MEKDPVSEVKKRLAKRRDPRNDGNELIMKVSGRMKRFPITRAKWCMEKGNIITDDPYLFCLRMEFDSDEEAEIIWEISFPEVELFLSDIRSGFVSGFKNRENSGNADFYYLKHKPTTRNKAEVLEKEGNDLLIKVTGKIAQTEDAEPETELEVYAWFEQINNRGMEKHFKCGKCGKAFFTVVTNNTIFLCPECHEYVGCECEYGYAAITPCEILMGEKEVAKIIGGRGEFFLVSPETEDQRLNKGYKNLEVYKEAAEIMKRKLG